MGILGYFRQKSGFSPKPFFFLSENIFPSLGRILYQLVVLVMIALNRAGRDPFNLEIYFDLATISSIESKEALSPEWQLATGK